MSEIDERDVDVVARTLWGEARGEGRQGMEAVAWVIRNRVETDIGNDGKPDWWGEGYEGVCKAPMQFSCWNADDPNREKLPTLHEGMETFREAKAIARSVMLGLVPDPTGGATHYHTKAVSPPWSKSPKVVKTAEIGRHTFFRERRHA